MKRSIYINVYVSKKKKKCRKTRIFMSARKFNVCIVLEGEQQKLLRAREADDDGVTR